MNKEQTHAKVLEMGFEWLNSPKFFDSTTTLFITPCTAQKSFLKKGTPAQIYTSPTIQKFYSSMRGLQHATLSDLYGLVFPDNVIENYDVPPSELSKCPEKLSQLIDLIAKQVPPHISTLVFCHASPLRSIVYFRLLESLPIKKYYITKLSYIGNINNKPLF
jgi:hypothetical protein